MSARITKIVGDCVLVEPHKSEEKTKSGILIPEDSQKPMQIGTITMLGTKSEGFKVGDRVVYEKYGPLEFEFGDTKYYKLDCEDIIAFYDED